MWTLWQGTQFVTSASITCDYSMLTRFSRLLSSRSPVCVRSFTSSSALGRPVDMETVNSTERLQRLRALMKQHKVDIYSMKHSVATEPYAD